MAHCGCAAHVTHDNGGADTPRSIQTWALEEARRRLEAEGILEDPEKKQ